MAVCGQSLRQERMTQNPTPLYTCNHFSTLTLWKTLYESPGSGVVLAAQAPTMDGAREGGLQHPGWLLLDFLLRGTLQVTRLIQCHACDPFECNLMHGLHAFNVTVDQCIDNATMATLFLALRPLCCAKHSCDACCEVPQNWVAWPQYTMNKIVTYRYRTCRLGYAA
jgi:hypothetical protein